MVEERKQIFESIEKKEITQLPEPKTNRPGFSVSKPKKQEN